MIRLFRVYIPISILVLLITEVLLIGGIFVGSILWQFDPIYLEMEDGWLQALVVTVTIVMGLYLSDYYERVRMQSQILLVQQYCLIIGMAFIVQAFFSYAQLPVRMPRQAMLLGSFVCMVILPLWRTIFSKLALQVLGAERVLFVGTHALQLRVAEFLEERPEYAMRPFGFVTEKDSRQDRCGSYPVLGQVSDLEKILDTKPVDRIIVGVADPVDQEIVAKIYQVVHSGRRVETAERVYEVLLGRVSLHRVPADQIFPADGKTSVAQVVQNVYNWIIALIAVILLAPVLAAVALAVRLTSTGPVLFRQVRAGRNNVPFLLYKFRSMYVDAEKNTGAVWAKANDPRVTPIGKYLRQYRLDELPQLINVLRGEMSLVGPRPNLPEEVAQYQEWHKKRLTVSPGITGLWQVSGRSDLTFDEMVLLDIYYVENWTLNMDVGIILRSLPAILRARGAY